MVVAPLVLQMSWTSLVGSKRVIVGAASEKAADLTFLKELVEAAKIELVIDRHYPFEQTVEVHRHVEKGHTKRNVVITVEHNDRT